MDAQLLGRLCNRLVVMSDLAFDMLNGIYDVPAEKVVMIPHGIPDVPFIDPSFYKDQFGVEGRKVLFTFGLLSPGKGLEYEVDKTLQFAIRHAALLPQLKVTKPKVEKVADKVYKISVQIANTGFMSTNVTKMAVKIKVAKPVLAEVKLPDGVDLVTGHEKVNLGHLEGRSAKLLLPRVIGGDVVDKTRSSVEWVVKTETDGPVDVTIETHCPRAGTDRVKVILQ